jgi:hypothetical protein
MPECREQSSFVEEAQRAGFGHVDHYRLVRLVVTHETDDTVGAGIAALHHTVVTADGQGSHVPECANPL